MAKERKKLVALIHSYDMIYAREEEPESDEQESGLW
jgi:hypothetical protein